MLAEFKDFSGGITDRDIPGPTNRYAVADNFLIDSDKQLFSRDGFDIFSSTAYQLGAAERVARLVNFRGVELLGAQNKNVYYVNAGAWTSLLGPTGNNPFNTNTAASLIQEAQWNNHLYLASDSGDPVVKIYRDGSNVLQLRSAGLPAFEQSILPADGGLALAISLANNLRTQMIAHYGSNGASAGTPNNSATGHHMTHADLTAQYNAVNGSTAATNLASLITLLGILREEYNEHIQDAQCADFDFVNYGISTARKYHVQAASTSGYMLYDTATRPLGTQPSYDWTHTLNYPLLKPNYSIPGTATIDQLLVYVNDLKLKWNLHTYAPGTHFNAWRFQGTEYYTGLGSHASSTANAETYTWAKISPSYGSFLRYVEDIKLEYGAHREATPMHQIQDTVNAVPSAYPSSATTLQDGIILLGALAYFMYLHGGDATQAAGTFQYTATATSGSPTLTGVVSPAADNSMIGLKCIPIIYTGTTNIVTNAYHTPSIQYRVTANSAGGATITHNNNFALSTVSPQGFTYTSSEYHLGPSPRLDVGEFNSDMASIDYTFPTAVALQGLATKANDLITYLKSHTLDKTVARSWTGLSFNDKYLNLSGNYYQVYNPTPDNNTDPGNNFLVHNWYSLNSGRTPNGGIFFPLYANRVIPASFKENHFDTVPTAVSINYKALFRYDYTIGTTSFTDFGNPSEAINIIDFANVKEADDVETGKYLVPITNLFSQANSTNQNWATGDTTNFRKELYRTVGNGQSYYRLDYDAVVGNVSNATTSFNDYTVDEFLVLQEELYTNGGEVANDKPPATGIIHQTEDRMYYAVKNILYQSKAADPDSVPGDFFTRLDKDIVGVSSTRSTVVAFTSEYVSRIEGTFDDLGQGLMRSETIFDRTGAVSGQAIVKAENAVFFAGKDGLYYTDGYQTFRITDLDDTFTGYTDTASKRNMIQATYNPVLKRVYFTVPDGGFAYPDVIWVVDLQFGVRPETTPVTRFTGHQPTALTVFDDVLHIGDKDGYVFKQTKGLLMDLVKDTGVAASSWAKKSVMWNFKQCHHDYGTGSSRKYFTRVTPQFKQQDTNLSVQIYSDADKGRSISNLPIIRSRKLSDWGDSKIDWTVAQYGASKSGEVIDEFRRFRGDGYLRSNFRSIGFQNAYCVVVASDNMGTANIANVSPNVWSATLTNATYKWPLYSVGYFLRINGVDYPVTTRISDAVIRISDSGLTALSVLANQEWELWGYPKNERARLMQFSVVYDLIGATQKDYQGRTSLDGGENA